MAKRYNEDFKNTIVDLYKSGESIPKLSDEYGIAKSTISGWIKNKKQITVDDNKTITVEEYKKLKKELAKIKEENQILKKAMAIFAKE
ncbi:transposase [Caldisalinibacter kiritimatiensis]|uniref:Transposase IS3/IS911 n=1 Tax=Caldisalinibacter kiritimatiensis TaxID=1304284 RepID=R1ASV0_9FIRM|nr:transposase [Caldisalinibacter kiritimatiensis]EOC99736.1 Transposase IS3/IS911 [Caldisalinibacter kiritimatiensis]